MHAATPKETPHMPETLPARAVACVDRPAIPPMHPSAETVHATDDACSKPIRLVRP